MIRLSPAVSLAAGLAATLVSSERLTASDDLVVDTLPVAEAEETVRFIPLDGHARIVLGNRPVSAEYDLAAVFDQHVFRRPGMQRPIAAGQPGITGEPDEGGPAGVLLGRLAGLRQIAARRIATLDRVCGLTAEQREILDLAVESDLRRLAVDIDAKRRSYVGQRLPARVIDHDFLQRVRDDAEACRRRIDQFGRSGTLLGSVSLDLLDSRQRAVFTEWVASRRASRWEAIVRTVLGLFDETGLGLSAGQHEALLERLLADVPPLEVFDDRPAGSGVARSADFHAMLVAGRLQRLTGTDLRERFDPRQWAILERLGSQYGAPEEIEPLLMDQGLLEETR